jgi:hypothetical protein
MECIIIVTVPGSLIEHINPEATFICLYDNINSNKFTQIHSSQSAWQDSWDAVQAACDMYTVGKSGGIEDSSQVHCHCHSIKSENLLYHLSDSKLHIFIYMHSC